MALCLCALHVSASDGNIYIAERTVTCDLSARDGRVTGARISQDYSMGARRVHDTGILAVFYDRNSKIEHASATGGKPQYRAWEDGDIFYSGTRVCLLPVEVKPGKTSRARAEVSYASPEFLDDIMLMLSLYDIERETVTVRIPADIAGRVTVDIFNATGRELMTRDTDTKGNVTVTVTAASMPKFRLEPMMPEAATCMPLVRISAAFDGTDELYDYLKSKLEDLDTPDAEVASLAGRLTAEAGTDTLARIDAAARWVRENIRYVAIEHGELAHRPASAAEVLGNRYGDCKGSANLICALLRAMGIDGRRVWIGTGGDITAPFSISHTLGAANHMIAAACVGDSTIFIDGTARNAPRGLVPAAIAGQECMVENGATYILTHVCRPYPAESLLRQTGSLRIDGNSLGGEMHYGFGGEWRCMIETAMDGITAARRPQVLAYFLSRDRKGFAVDDAEMLPSAAPDAETSAMIASVCDSEGVKAVAGRTKLYVMPRLLRMVQPRTVDARGRRWPIVHDDFMPMEADVAIEVPAGYAAEGLPRTAVIDNPWFEGFVTYTAGADGTVRCTAELRQRLQYAEASEAEAWNAAVREVENASNTALILLKGPAD